MEIGRVARIKEGVAEPVKRYSCGFYILRIRYVILKAIKRAFIGLNAMRPENRDLA